MNGFATKKYFYILDIVLLSLLFSSSHEMWVIFLCSVRTQDSCILQSLRAYQSAVLIHTKLVNWQHVKKYCRKVLMLIYFNFKRILLHCAYNINHVFAIIMAI